MSELLPTQAAFPWVSVVRRGRLRISATSIALLRGGRTVREHRVGGDGIVDAVLLTTLAAPAKRDGGYLVFRDRDAAPLATLEPNDWVPEWPDGPLSVSTALERSGLRAALAEVGIPLRMVTSAGDPAYQRLTGIERLAPLRSDSVLATPVVWLVTSALWVLWVAGTVLFVRSDPPGWWALTGVLAVGLFVGAAAGGPFATVLLRSAGSVVARPRGLGRARVGRAGEYAVLVDRYGSERWLPLPGSPTPGPLRSVVMVAEGLELRDGADHSRAFLPETAWAGAATLADLADRVAGGLGLPRREGHRSRMASPGAFGPAPAPPRYLGWAGTPPPLFYGPTVLGPFFLLVTALLILPTTSTARAVGLIALLVLVLVLVGTRLVVRRRVARWRESDARP